MISEFVRPSREYKGILATVDGRIFHLTNTASNGNLIQPLKLKKGNHPDGYHMVSVNKDGKQTPALVHRIVAGAFIPNPEGKPEVNHIDLDKTNNSIFNLEWCTHAENMKHYSDNRQL